MSSLGTRPPNREEPPPMGESGTSSSVARRSNNDRLKELLVSLGHLNKTGSIEDMKSVRGAYGGIVLALFVKGVPLLLFSADLN